MVPRFNPEDPASLWGIGFADLGALWEKGGGKRSIWTAGAGVRLQTGRVGVVGFDFGVTDLGVNVSVVSFFAF